MPAIDVNSLFARAEQAFVSGRLDAARADLAQVQRAAGDHPAVLHLLALVEKKRGATDASAHAFRAALRLSPNDPQINNNFGNLLESMGELTSALAHFDRAVAAAPQLVEARYNRALLLQKLERLEDALAELNNLAKIAPPTAKLHSARAGVLRELGRLEEASEAYEAALTLDPSRLISLHGRARVAMERGEPDASSRYRRALQVAPGDLSLRLGLAEALEAEGNPQGLDVLAQAIAEHPQWAEGQSALARMRWEAGEGSAFKRDFERALEASPGNRELWIAYASVLAAVDLSIEAAEAAARGRARVGDDDVLQLLEALHASEAGELGRADSLFARLPADLPGRSIHEMRHAIRRKDYDYALELAERARAEDEWGVGAWAMTGLLWRIMEDPRAEWLHGQAGLVRMQLLKLSSSQIEAIADTLRSLHRTRAHPIGQSLRGGTQTRGRLFERDVPEIDLLREEVFEAVQAHWDRLPPEDPSHPLLRHRQARPRFDGSWSVRLSGGGFHVSHVHPHGVLSSACYIVVPEGTSEGEGCLEIGRPPGQLHLPLAPMFEIAPQPGHLVLFPSTLHHGTRPFSRGERLSVAFDIAPA